MPHKVKLIGTKKNYWAYYPSDDKNRPSTRCMLWKIKYVPKQISQNKKQKQNRLCSLINRNIKKKNLIVVELLIPQESSKKEKTKRKKSNQKSIKLFDDQVLSKFDEGQNSEKKIKVKCKEVSSSKK